jgi:hypothetical protein
MAPSHSIGTFSTALPPGRTPGARSNGAMELAAASLAILQELEASLAASQQALLARNLEAMESGIERQQRLQRALAILWGMNQRGGNAAMNQLKTANSLELNENTLRQPILLPKELQGDARLQAAAANILHLARVQKALLVRAQQSLRMIGHLAAGAQANYQAPASLGQERKGTSCRA